MNRCHGKERDRVNGYNNGKHMSSLFITRQRNGELHDEETHCMFSYSLQVLNSRGHLVFIPLLLYWLIVSGLLQSSNDSGFITRYRTVSQHSPPNMMYPAAVDRLAS